MDNNSEFTPSTLRHQTRLASGLIPLLNLLQSLHVDTSDILRHAKIRKFELIDPAFTISFEQELKIVDHALPYLRKEHSALELSEYYHLHNFSVLGLAIRTCDTLGDIFDLILRYPRLVWGVCETSSRINGSNISFQLKAGETKLEKFLLERDMACIKTLFGEALNDELKLISVKFSYSAPKNISTYEKFFNCPVYFEQAISELTFPIAELKRKVPTADPLSKEFYEAQCVRLSTEIDDPFRYTYLIRDHLSRMTPIPSLEALSEKLNIEPRTLQRLLKKEQETFSAILKEVRLKRAENRLQYSSFNIEQIASELGFNDAVAFSHAFKEWFGISPKQWRTQLIL